MHFQVLARFRLARALDICSGRCLSSCNPIRPNRAFFPTTPSILYCTVPTQPPSHRLDLFPPALLLSSWAPWILSGACLLHANAYASVSSCLLSIRRFYLASQKPSDHTLTPSSIPQVRPCNKYLSVIQSYHSSPCDSRGTIKLRRPRTTRTTLAIPGPDLVWSIYTRQVAP